MAICPTTMKTPEVVIFFLIQHYVLSVQTIACQSKYSINICHSISDLEVSDWKILDYSSVWGIENTAR